MHIRRVIICCFVLIPLFSVHTVYASYTLPYPSFMPGNKLYTASRIYDRVMRYWNFGDIASSRFHLGLSDKYLVESKTLFEYGQYLLALDALMRSDTEFLNFMRYLSHAEKKGRNMSDMRQKGMDASRTHIRVLGELAETLPQDYVWSQENENSRILGIKLLLTQAMSIRRSFSGKEQ